MMFVYKLYSLSLFWMLAWLRPLGVVGFLKNLGPNPNADQRNPDVYVDFRILFLPMYDSATILLV